jgi:hypothetical protein
VASPGPVTSFDLRRPDADATAPAAPALMSDLRAEPLDQGRGRRAGGIALIVVLLLLLALGAGIGVLMFRVTGLSP